MNNRIEAAMRDAGHTQTSLAELMGVTPQAVQQWVKGKSHPKGERLKRLASILKADVNWLITGDGDAHYKRRIDDSSNAGIAPKLGAFNLVPVVGHAQLGDSGYWCDLEYPSGHGDGYVKYAVRDSNAYALRCVGDSMKPRIRDGEFVIAEPNYAAQPGDDVMLRSTDGRVMVKTYLYTRDDRVFVMSINENHPPQSFALEDVDKIHPIAGIASKFAWTQD